MLARHREQKQQCGSYPVAQLFVCGSLNIL
jgi:hypothetical protein